MKDIQTDIEQDSVVPTRQTSKFLWVLADIASYVFHPTLMATVMTVVLYRLAPIAFAGVSPVNFGRWVAMIVLNTVAFPLITVGLLKPLGFLQSFRMHDTRSRIVPLMAAMIFYFWAYNVFRNVMPPLILRTLILGAFWGTIVLFMINIFVKISIHATAAGCMLGILIVLMMLSPINMVVPLFIALVIAGVIGTARLIRRANTPAEIWLGYIIGILVQVCAYWFLK